MGITVFNFNAHEVRTLIKDGEPWFVAKDVCDVLGLTNSRKAVERIPSKDKGVTRSDTPGGVQNLSIISEAGLYRLVLRSDKPAAEPFIDWVTSEVLPAIRKTGGYIAAKAEETPEEILARALIVAKETIDRVQERNRKLQTENENMKPKALFADAVSSSQTSMVLTGMRGKPRPSGRGRIARTHLPFPVSSPIFSLRRQDMPCQPVERW